MAHILLTRASGLVGDHLLSELLQNGHQAYALSRSHASIVLTSYDLSVDSSKAILQLGYKKQI